MTNIADIEMSVIILANIVKSKVYASKVISDLDIRFFTDDTEIAIASTIMDINLKYNKIPTRDEIVSTMKENSNVHGLDKNVINDVLGDSLLVENFDWLVDQTERFIKRKRTMLVFEETFGDYEAGNVEVDGFYMKFQEAAAFTFDSSVGHSLVNDSATRFELYTAKANKLPFYIDMLDKITQGGADTDGTLNILMAGVGAGKSIFLGDIAAKNAMHGKKVLVISLEMAEIKLTERIESNLMDVPINQIKKMDRCDYMSKQKVYLDKMRLVGGDIIFKQFPTRSAHAGHFRNLIAECKNNLGYNFDLIVIDYLNICASQNAPKGSNSYTEVKGIAEELRAMTIELQLPIWSATQSNREGQDSSDLSLNNVSESHGLSATADLLLAMMATEDWDTQKKVQIKQLKNRYGDVSYYNRFFIGRDKQYMRLFNLDDDAQNTVMENRNKPNKFEDNTPLKNKIDTSVIENEHKF